MRSAAYLPVLKEVNGLIPASRLPDTPARDVHGRWGLGALEGRFSELSGGTATGALSLVAKLIREAQGRGDMAVWVGRCGSIFYPPDFALAGIHLDALPVIQAVNAVQMADAADTLMRSGAVSLIVLDLGRRSLPLAIQTRLTGLAKKYDTALVALTRTSNKGGICGSLVSLRGYVDKERTVADRFDCTVRVEKDKYGRPGREFGEVYHGPLGLC